MDQNQNFLKDTQRKSTSPKEKCLNMISKVEDMVFTFQSHQNTSRSPRVKERKKHKEEEVYEIIPPLKKAVEILKSRIATAPSPMTNMNMPNIRRFKQSLPTEGLLGPGCYKIKNKIIQQELDFFTIPKLDEKMIHRLNTLKARRKSLIEDPTKITIFDDFVIKSPREMIDPKERARIHNERIEMVRTIGKEIKEYNLQTKKNKLFEKLERIK